MPLDLSDALAETTAGAPTYAEPPLATVPPVAPARKQFAATSRELDMSKRHRTDKAARARHRKARKRQQKKSPQHAQRGLFAFSAPQSLCREMMQAVEGLGGDWLVRPAEGLGDDDLLLFTTTNICDKRYCRVDHAAGARALLADVLAGNAAGCRWSAGFPFAPKAPEGK
jgi:hypothetical protein